MIAKTFLKSEAFSVNSENQSENDEVARIEDPLAVAHEERARRELTLQFKELKRQARGIFPAVEGRVGAGNAAYLEEVFAKAREAYGAGQFLMQRMGADRQLDLPLVATLTQLRQGILAEIENPSAADHMIADAAVVAYRNLLRVQGWLGSLCLELERTLFGQDGPSGTDLREVEEMIERIETKIVPIQERCQRMLLRALDRLETHRSSKNGASVSIGVAGQVNVG